MGAQFLTDVDPNAALNFALDREAKVRRERDAARNELARATLLERDRCAKVVVSRIAHPHFDGKRCGMCTVLHEIAETIRRGGK